MTDERDDQNRASGERESSESDDLKDREYRDKEGNIHHHTHAYQEGHSGETERGEDE